MKQITLEEYRKMSIYTIVTADKEYSCLKDCQCKERRKVLGKLMEFIEGMFDNGFGDEETDIAEELLEKYRELK